ncbi:hypothetical protein F4677DRAFT_159533 [Hypoxylon crocopeplum]|nr:hypothetical protein F4677DRAFT_159533 [Hypoxylon crocopeplum]
MPATTEYFGHTITNLGPLTTTFTVSPACTTATDTVYYANASALASFFGQPVCSTPSYGDCFPSGAVLDSIVRSEWATPGQDAVIYFSPGLVCPSGWTTAGTLRHASAANGTSSMDASGVFTQDAWNWSSAVDAAGLPVQVIQSKILSAAETLALCCPSGYNADADGHCYSLLGPPTLLTRYSEACYSVLPTDDVVIVSSYDGTTWTPALLSITPVVPSYSIASGELTGSAWSSLKTDVAVVTYVAAVPLIYQASDTPNAGVPRASPDLGLSIFIVVPIPVSSLAGVGLMVPL